MNYYFQKSKQVFNLAQIHPGKKEDTKQLLESFHIPYYIPSDDDTLSFSFGYIFKLPNLVNLILVEKSNAAHLSRQKTLIEFYLQNNGEPIDITEMQYKLFRFVVHRETPGIILDGEGVKPGIKTPVCVVNGPFKGFEGVLPPEDKDGYALVLEIAPVFSWHIPIAKQDIKILTHRAYTLV